MSSGESHSLVDRLTHFTHDQGIHVTAKPLIYLFTAMSVAFLILDPGQTLRNFKVLLLLSPFWLSYLLVTFSLRRWLSANRMQWLEKQEHVLLEIRVPRDVRKTPLAMETVLTSMHLSPGESTWWKKHVEGRVRPWWSFEIVSLGGRVHLYVWTRAGFRKAVESFFYAQYPGIEIVEATDYARVIDPSHEPYDLWGCDYQLTKGDALPIRTYQEFIKPDSPLAKPEEQIDPLAQIIEMMGSIGPKEQFWTQIMFRVHKGEKFSHKVNKQGKEYTIRDEANERLEEFRKSTVRTTSVVDPVTGAVRETESFPNPSRGVQLAMEEVERKVSKPLFDVSIRSIYTAPGDAFQGIMISQLIGMWKPFHSEVVNNFGITRWMANFDDQPWQDRSGHHRAHIKRQITDAYRRRMAFHEPYRLPYFVLNTEELASLFHIPSSGVTTPSLPRIQSSTAEAPSNLPT